MRAVVQRVSQASLLIEGQEAGAMPSGLVVLLGIAQGDKHQDADWLVRKIVQMRIFEDGKHRMNRSLLEVEGSLMCVSQFTLHASTRKGHRPSFFGAAQPEEAMPLYEYVLEKCANFVPQARMLRGRFGAHMELSFTNDGPVTIILDSRDPE